MKTLIKVILIIIVFSACKPCGSNSQKHSEDIIVTTKTKIVVDDMFYVLNHRADTVFIEIVKIKGNTIHYKRWLEGEKFNIDYLDLPADELVQKYYKYK